MWVVLQNTDLRSAALFPMPAQHEFQEVS
jgi:hypothetical protein